MTIEEMKSMRDNFINGNIVTTGTNEELLREMLREMLKHLIFVEHDPSKLSIINESAKSLDTKSKREGPFGVYKYFRGKRSSPLPTVDNISIPTFKNDEEMKNIVLMKNLIQKSI